MQSVDVGRQPLRGRSELVSAPESYPTQLPPGDAGWGVCVGSGRVGGVSRLGRVREKMRHRLSY